MASTELLYIAMLIATTVVISVLVVQTSRTIDEARVGVSEVLEGFISEQVEQDLR